jgi:hypothetical protein
MTTRPTNHQKKSMGRSVEEWDKQPARRAVSTPLGPVLASAASSAGREFAGQ